MRWYTTNFRLLPVQIFSRDDRWMLSSSERGMRSEILTTVISQVKFLRNTNKNSIIQCMSRMNVPIVNNNMIDDTTDGDDNDDGDDDSVRYLQFYRLSLFRPSCRCTRNEIWNTFFNSTSL